MVELVTFEEAAKELRLSIYTLRAWCHQNRMPFIRLGRRVLLRREDLEQFVNKNRVEADTPARLKR